MNDDTVLYYIQNCRNEKSSIIIKKKVNEVLLKLDTRNILNDMLYDNTQEAQILTDYILTLKNTIHPNGPYYYTITFTNNHHIKIEATYFMELNLKVFWIDYNGNGNSIKLGKVGDSYELPRVIVMDENKVSQLLKSIGLVPFLNLIKIYI
ncbi:Hypothetical protein ORPV_866 [Orpheovirus IHUMI-LCC2]|uniref:Uncharacterized protein n=1 Tax=Orpheovirus IHUMI-LCC2 TaxID=2023057 RepID=A0A2I2L5J6_9VIRU|nr:Hypothetical protein ORPV_866 [Orpheovirus IHUMI-LCC2]SNW62770.1 Hypothetical protein ORPV_866 [Orpheovirus IHUMI-LCC2]